MQLSTKNAEHFNTEYSGSTKHSTAKCNQPPEHNCPADIGNGCQFPGGNALHWKSDGSQWNRVYTHLGGYDFGFRPRQKANRSHPCQAAERA